jgi:hypothetical protein
MTTTTAQRRVARAEYDRLFRSIRPLRKVKHIDTREAERRIYSSPCFQCEARGPCRHRPWTA